MVFSNVFQLFSNCFSVLFLHFKVKMQYSRRSEWFLVEGELDMGRKSVPVCQNQNFSLYESCIWLVIYRYCWNSRVVFPETGWLIRSSTKYSSLIPVSIEMPYIRISKRPSTSKTKPTKTTIYPPLRNMQLSERTLLERKSSLIRNS